MTWRDTGKLTGADMLFIGGVLVGAAVAVLVVLAGVLAVFKMAIGG